MLNIIPIPAFTDNYIWLLYHKGYAVVVDPGNAKPVIETLKKLNLTLAAILVTHHHSDHIDGVNELLAYQETKVYAPKYENFRFKHTQLSEGDELVLSEIEQTFKILWLPGHTLGHIAYVNNHYLFCGDTLFGAGCGRLFEGSPEQMFQSLSRLKALKPKTKVFCTHEYTSRNIEFALSLEPDNQDLIERKHEVATLREENLPSLPSTMALELKTNPFLRCNHATIIKNSQATKSDEISVFTAIRTLRNHY